MESIVLIGMPSSGKSTAGKLLAERFSRVFIDCDDRIRAFAGDSLDRLIASRGAEGFLALEEEVLCALKASGAVVATGGSAVYSPLAMAHLKTLGKLVYLKLDEAEIERRIPDFTCRGVVMRGSVSTLKELYAERVPLYEAYAEYTVDCNGRTVEQTAAAIAVIAGWRI